jgi:hypothetical protein
MVPRWAGRRTLGLSVPKQATHLLQRVACQQQIAFCGPVKSPCRIPVTIPQPVSQGSKACFLPGIKILSTWLLEPALQFSRNGLFEVRRLPCAIIQLHEVREALAV